MFAQFYQNGVLKNPKTVFIILIVIIIIYIITYNKKWLSRTQPKPSFPSAYDVLKTIKKSPRTT